MSIEQKSLILPSRTIAYTLRESVRARRIRLTVRADGSVVLTVPAGSRLPWRRAAISARAERFVQDHAAWLVRKNIMAYH